MGILFAEMAGIFDEASAYNDGNYVKVA